MRLLICDDNKPLVDALSMALTHLGHTIVATALTPDQGVVAARQHEPDACLLDIGFPRENGLSVISRIRNVSADTKVVMLSGSISTELVADAMALGAAGFVGKEKPISVIAEALEQACQGHFAVDPIFLPATRAQHVVREDSTDEGLTRVGALREVSPTPAGNLQVLTRWRHRPAARSRPGLRDQRGQHEQD
jgi:DNA-binding NarL/FixJ family response regulator